MEKVGPVSFYQFLFINLAWKMSQFLAKKNSKFWLGKTLILYLFKKKCLERSKEISSIPFEHIHNNINIV